MILGDLYKNYNGDLVSLLWLKKAFLTFLLIKLLEYLYFKYKFGFRFPKKLVNLCKTILFILLFIPILTFTLFKYYQSTDSYKKHQEDVEYKVDKNPK